MIGSSDQKRFTELYNDYVSMVRGVLYSMTGKDALDDLTQETFIRVWKGLPQFSFRSTTKTWVYRITLNTAVDYLRRKKSLNNLNSELLERSVNEFDTSTVSYNELIEMALTILDDDSRGLVILFYFEDLSIKEIAKILEVPEGTVKSRMHQAKKKMQAFFDSKGVSL